MQEIKAQEEFDKAVKENKKVFAFFSASWCGVCHATNPVVEKLSKEFSGISFIKIDIDKFQEIVMLYGIQAIPFFIIFKNGEPIEKFKGIRNLEEIREKLN
jgi:thioredoxin 1